MEKYKSLHPHPSSSQTLSSQFFSYHFKSNRRKQMRGVGVEEEGKNDISFCPSFASYSFQSTLETAVRVAAESQDDGFEFLHHQNQDVSHPCIFPFFDTCLSAGEGDNKKLQRPQRPRLPSTPSRFSLKQLFFLEPPTSSGHRSPPDAHPVHSSMRKKSNSTGSSSTSPSSSSPFKRCKLRDLLRRCQSDGRDSRLLTKKKKEDEESASTTIHEKSKGEQRSVNSVWMMHHNFYSNKNKKPNGEGDRRRKSYLPYRQDLLGTIF